MDSMDIFLNKYLLILIYAVASVIKRHFPTKDNNNDIAWMGKKKIYNCSKKALANNKNQKESHLEK